MPRTGKLACKTVASLTWTSFCRLVRLLTNQAVGLLLVGSICVLSLLLSFRNYPYSPKHIFANMRMENEELQPPILDPETQVRNENSWNANEHPQNASPNAYPQQKPILKGTAVLSPQNPTNISENKGIVPKDSFKNETVRNTEENLQNQNTLDVNDSPNQDSPKLPLEEAISDDDNSSGKKVASIIRP